MLVLLLSESETVTGCLREAVVEGFRSWCGEGLRLMEAVWMVEASSRAGLDIVGALGWVGVRGISGYGMNGYLPYRCRWWAYEFHREFVFCIGASNLL